MDSVEPSSATDEIVASTALPALGWARVLLFAKQHGVVAALCLMMAYQVGIIATVQTTMCGV